MAKQNSTPKYVTREILKKEISASEKRLDAKIETTAQSYKDYTDHRFSQLDAKMTKYFELMMQTFTDGYKGINKILSNHEERITVLEARGPQPGRI
jgi:anaerobic ribonucleoside-triphosphate reductase